MPECSCVRLCGVYADPEQENLSGQAMQCAQIVLPVGGLWACPPPPRNFWCSEIGSGTFIIPLWQVQV